MFYNTYITYITYETYRTYPALYHIPSTDYLTTLYNYPSTTYAGDPLYLPITHKKTAA